MQMRCSLPSQCWVPLLPILKLLAALSLRRQHTLNPMATCRGLATADLKGLQQTPSCPRLAGALHRACQGCRQVPDSEQGVSDGVSKHPKVFL